MVGRAASIPEQFNIAQYFVERSLDEGRGDVVAVFYREHRLTYRRTWELVNRAANALERGGVQRLDRVLLLLHDSPAFAAAFLGAIKLGAVPVPANTLLLPEDYEFMLRDSGARSLVVERGLLQKVGPALAKLSGGQGRWGDLETVYVAGQLVGSGTTVEYPGGSERVNEPGYKSFDEEVDLSLPEAAAAPTHRDDPAFWLYTSGSTGRPKAAIHRHRDMVYCLEHYAG